MPPLIFTLAVHRPGQIAVVVVFAVVMVVLCRVGRRLGERERRFRTALGIVTLAISLLIAAWYALHERFDPSWMLPLHICDLAGFIAPLALLTRWRPARIVTYFWAFGLTTQGFITPIVAEGPDSVRFYAFWLNHAIVVGCAIYDLVVARLRPTGRDLLATLAGTLAYAGAIFLLNRALDWNYLFLGPSKPGATTIIDALGPYPLRVAWIILLAGLAMSLAYLPWAILRRARPTPTPHAARSQAS